MKSLRLALHLAAVFPIAAGAAAPGATVIATGEKAEADAATALSRENQRLAADLARAEAAVRDVQAALARQSTEIAATRAEMATTRIQLAKAQGELAAVRTPGPAQAMVGQSAIDANAAAERERTAHVATKAILAQRENQVQELLASRTKLESENRVLKASTDLAKDTAGFERKAALVQNAELATKVAVLTRDLNSARSEITTVRQELRNQTAKAANQAESHLGQVAALQESLTAARNELSQAKSALDANAQANAATMAARAQAEAQLGTMRTQIADLERELQAATTTTRRLAADQARFEAAQRDAVQAQAQLAAANRELETLRQQSAAAQRDLGAARTEVDQLKSSLAGAASQSSATKSQAESQIAKLQNEVTRLQREAQAASPAPEAELARLREALAKAEAAPKLSAADLAAVQIQERQLAALEQELISTRSQLGQTRSALDAAARSAAANSAAKAEAESQLVKLRSETTGLQRELAAATTAAQKQGAAYETENARLQGVLARSNLSPSVPLAEFEAAQRDASLAQRRLAAAGEEIESLRAQVAAAREVEKRARPLDANPTSLNAGGREAIDKEDYAQVAAARAAAEDKLGIALRAYSLLARERDELRGQFESLSTRIAAAKVDPAPVSDPAIAASPLVTPPVSTFAAPPLPARGRSTTRIAATTRGVTSNSSPRATSLSSAALVSPPVVTPGQPAFSHRIAPGETLSSIARRYYGNATRWTEIVAANLDVLPDQRSFSAGKMIRIP